MARGAEFDIAIVDVNLRGVDIYPVVDNLARRGIPFALATRFSAKGVAGTHRARPLVHKPIHGERMREILRMLPGA